MMLIQAGLCPAFSYLFCRFILALQENMATNGII
ncbi:MAG: hypothetical protein K0R55_1377 [Sporomusa sp.]|nr:hypothetical protein [Sporomusa sp.]